MTLAMEIATYLLLALGLLGATDVFLFHTIAHGLRRHPDSRWELVTHSLRGPTYCALFLVVPNFQMQGTWCWMLVGLLVVDVGISVWDFWLERRSRDQLGGLPTGEYLLHMVMAMVFGAMVISILAAVPRWVPLPTGIVYAPAAVPETLRLVLGMMAIGVLVSGLQDAWAVRRLARRA